MPMRTTPDSIALRIQQALKHGLAMTLFLAILLGGGTAAFSLLAAGIATLSNLSPQGQTVSVVPSSQLSANLTGQTGSKQSLTHNRTGQVSSGAGVGTSGTHSTTSRSSGSGPGAAGTTGESAWNQQVQAPSVIDLLNNQIDHMHSPLVGMVDAGGVTVGNRVQAAFGQVLASLVKTLFIERN